MEAVSDVSLPVRSRPAEQARERRSHMPSVEARWLWLAVLVFVAVSFWWLTQDNRIPIFDGAYHMDVAYGDSQFLSHGQLSKPFTEYFQYPPLVHLVGAVAILLVGLHPMALVMTANVVFVPLLAFGCYGVGKLVAGPRAGLLAGLFGLGTPMFVSMIHDYFLDTPQAAMVAVTLWALLASRRFERRGVAVLAGVLWGLSLLVKETSLVFVGGAVLAVVIRGGWRNWVGVLGFAAAVAVVAGPWYLYHYHDEIRTLTQVGQQYVNADQSPSLWSLPNFGWYFWNLVNQQALLPLTLAFLVGVVIAIRRCVADRFSSSSLLPELLAGGLGAYLVMTYLTHKDPRYTLPILLYVAVLGTFWIPQLSQPRLRRAVTTALIAVVIVDFVGMATGIGGTRRIMVSLPGARTTLIYPGHLTLFENQGWLRGGPKRDGDARALLVGLRRMGVTRIALDPTVTIPDFSTLGYAVLVSQLGLALTPTPAGTPASAFIFVSPPQPGAPAPCQHMLEGLELYAVRGNAAGINTQHLRASTPKGQRYEFVCPGRATVSWAPA